ncbi:hypothetical protein FAM09_00010 [Niastella caeni]|uniref:Uncharacterized protein n=1 Tax=Niastella caeni TaxID=2569763 RepID=A0A4V4H1I0_9BACT|nr:hypothetical protein [Niastella caeni]THU40536.1 hypothetical protein FAM09_00010 [Niastella caeni]
MEHCILVVGERTPLPHLGASLFFQLLAVCLGSLLFSQAAGHVATDAAKELMGYLLPQGTLEYFYKIRIVYKWPIIIFQCVFMQLSLLTMY